MLTRTGFLRISPVLLLLLLGMPRISTVFAGEPQWVEVRSPNFSVVTDAGEHSGREVAMRFEQMRAVFGTLLTKANVNLPVPLQIVAFRNTKELRQVAPIFHGKPTQISGLFQGGADRSFIMLDMSADNPWTVVFHEYAHQLLNGNMQATRDPWFEEGFAEYFSSIEVNGKEARVGKIPNDDYLIMQRIAHMRIADLFKVQQYSETYNENGNSRTTFYIESGMLVHYLYDNQLLSKVSTYLELKIDKHVPVEEAIQQAFGMSPAQFDKVLRDYMAAGRYRYYSIPAPPHLSIDRFTSRALTLADARAVLADIHLHSPDYQEKAVAEFQEILKSDANNAAACRGLGYAYLQKQDFKQAAEYFKCASNADSKDPRVHYYNALLMAREGGFSTRSDIPALTQELETSISMDPDFADSYALLAFAQSASGDAAKALETMKKALAMDPRNESYRFNIANIYLANREPEKAIAVLESLQKTASPEMASQIASTLENLRQFHHPQSSTPAVGLVYRESSEAPPVSEGSAASTATTASAGPKWSAPIFLQGTVSSVDCSVEPSALLTISSGAKTLKLKVADKGHVILIGADQFSCAWTKKKVAVNYRQNEAGDTNVMSLELQ